MKEKKQEKEGKKVTGWLASCPALLYIFPHTLYMILHIHMMILRIQSVSFKNTHTFPSFFPDFVLIRPVGPTFLSCPLVRFILGSFFLL